MVELQDFEKARRRLELLASSPNANVKQAAEDALDVIDSRKHGATLRRALATSRPANTEAEQMAAISVFKDVLSKGIG